MNYRIDLRSDTLTLPTPSMRAAMAAAEVGDDVFGEDPTVRRLEETAAARLGKQAALFVASGTMANLVSLLTHCGRGDEVILGDMAHIFLYEQGGMAALGGIHPRTLPTAEDGTLDLAAIAEAIRGDDAHFPVSRLVALENTHNRRNGAPLPPAYVESVARLAHDRGLLLHMDGARVFNAATALGLDVAQVVAPADSVSFCLSKGLAAPVGSLVCGTAEFIARARRARKALGGGMRQAGVIAAAGLVALSEMTERLAEDHENARRLALGMAELRGLSLEPDRFRTNIVYADIVPPAAGSTAPMDAAGFTAALAGEGVGVLPVGSSRVRMVTHWGITREDIDGALAAFRRVLGRA